MQSQTSGYQTEAALEQRSSACSRARRTSTCRYDRNGLIANLRTQLETLNGITFSDSEWERFFTERIAGDGRDRREDDPHPRRPRATPRARRRHHQEHPLIDKPNVHNNRLQVINQYEVDGNYANRYDVTVLVNGLPMVHIELKRRGVAIREAFNQINRYQRDSFWAGRACSSTCSCSSSATAR